MKVPSDGDSLTLLNNLVELKLHCCTCCEQVPSLGNLPNLKYLEMSYMYDVKSIGSEFYGIDNGGGKFSGRRLFPALKLFKLHHLENLVEWKAPEVDDTVAAVFPSLEELQIGYCKGLTKIPTSHLSSLEKLGIDMCAKLEYMFDEVQSFPRLKSFGIMRSSLTCIPSALQFCTLLEELSIRKCECLSSIPEGLGKLKSLVSLEICPCYELKEFHWEIIASLTGLKRLKVGGFSTESEDLSYLNSIQHLSSLQELTIMRSNSISLPRQLQHLTSLKYLEIRCFYKLKVLPEWLGNLSSLEAILIVLCEDLVNLPSATAMKRLSKLTLLHICGCGRRWRRCVVARGSEWHKISHIPKIVIE